MFCFLRVFVCLFFQHKFCLRHYFFMCGCLGVWCVWFLVWDGWSASQQASGEVSSGCWLHFTAANVLFFLFIFLDWYYWRVYEPFLVEMKGLGWAAFWVLFNIRTVHSQPVPSHLFCFLSNICVFDWFKDHWAGLFFRFLIFFSGMAAIFLLRTDPSYPYLYPCRNSWRRRRHQYLNNTPTLIERRCSLLSTR